MGVNQMTLLVLAALLTAVAVGAIRLWINDQRFDDIQPQEQVVRGAVGSIATFAAGGSPAVLTTWLLARRESRVSFLRSFRLAALGNLASLLPGLIVLRMLIWDTGEWLLVTVSLAAVGTIGFTAVLQERQRKSHADRSQSAHPSKDTSF